MMFFMKNSSRKSSRDAKTVAPCFRVAGKSVNSVFFADIVFAVSVFLCLICALSLIDIIGIIIILNIIIIISRLCGKKRTLSEAI